MVKLASVSVDLDEIDCYAAIHGLTGLGLNTRAVYERALPRLVALFDELEIRATFFAIGSHLSPENGALLRALHEAGHEIGNHSLHHHYDLTRRPRAEQRAEIVGGADAIERAVGERPVGFRAPGYTMTSELLREIADSGAAYDSSVFPCPAYYLAKTAVISWMRLRGRRSSSLISDPRGVLLAPADPYRTGTPFYRPGAGLLELPIGVTGAFSGRLPFIGTNVASAGEAGARALAHLMRGRPFVNFEWHGIDLSDAALDGLSPLVRYQPDLRLNHQRKRAALRSAVLTLKGLGYRFVTLREAARTFGAAS